MIVLSKCYYISLWYFCYQELHNGSTSEDCAEKHNKDVA